jgi:hypothetical protein
MVDLPSYPRRLTTLETPKSSLTGAEFASPDRALAGGLAALGEGLSDIAEPLAQQAGARSVTRDADGNIQIERPPIPIVGKAGAAFAEAARTGAESLARNDVDIALADLRAKYPTDPDAFRTASEAFREKFITGLESRVGPGVADSIRRSAERAETQHYISMVNARQQRVVAESKDALDAQIETQWRRLNEIARQNGADTEEFTQEAAKLDDWMARKVNNPLFAYPQERAALDRAKGFDELYKSDAIGKTSRAYSQGGFDVGRQALTDVVGKLKGRVADPDAIERAGVTWLNAAEADRRRRLVDARADFRALESSSALGSLVSDADVERVAAGFRAAGSKADEARVYVTFARKPLNDDFGKQPLAAQAQQLAALRSSFAERVVHLESTGDANARPLDPVTGKPRSSALGPAQFTERTWLNLVRQARPDLSDGKTDEQILALRTDPVLSREMTARNAEQNRAVLVQRGVRSDDGALYLAHVLGPDDAAKVLAASPDTPLKGLVRPESLAANPELAEKSPTAGALASWADRKIGMNPATPGGAAWLIINRSRTTSAAAESAWKTVADDWDKKQIRPTDAAISQVIDAARASGNTELLSRIANDVERFNLVQSQGQRPLPEQQAALSSLNAAASDGSLSPGQASVIGGLQKRYDTVRKGLDDNPIATAAANFPDLARVPAPIDPTNPEAFRAGLAYRGRIAQFAAQKWQTTTPPALDESDMAQLRAVLQTADLATKARIYSDMTTALPEPVRMATFAKLGTKGAAERVDAYAGALFGAAPDVSIAIISGAQAKRADARFDPVKEGKSTFNDAFDKLLPATTFGIGARVNEGGALVTIREAVRAHYAFHAAQAGDTSGDLNEARLRASVDAVTGGVLRHNGATLIAPARGMTQQRFDGVLAAMTDADLAGVTTLMGEPVTADYLRRHAKLESSGDGRYLIRLGNDAARPIYAFRGADTESPYPFELDLRGRQPVEGYRNRVEGVEFRPYPRG